MKVLAKLNVKDISEFSKIPNNKEILELCHISNTILSAMRPLKALNTNNEIFIPGRDTLHSLLCICSFTFEGIKRTSSIIKKLDKAIIDKFKTQISWLHAEIKCNESFYHKILDPIRNELSFHFGKNLSMENLKNFFEVFPMPLLSGKSTNNMECAFILSDQLLMKKICELIDKDLTKEKESMDKLLRDLAQYSTTFFRFVDDLIAELLIKYSISVN
ncbi:MAG: hypothetical protein ABSH06_12995 [Thermodesulfobacteriota bacterium]